MTKQMKWLKIQFLDKLLPYNGYFLRLEIFAIWGPNLNSMSCGDIIKLSIKSSDELALRIIVEKER